MLISLQRCLECERHEEFRLNFQKHKIHLSTAILFIEADNDPDVEYDEVNSTLGEIRYRGVYRWNDHYLFIVYTMREETIRLISARPATKGEVEKYYQRE